MRTIIVSSMRRKLTNRSVLINLLVLPLLLIVILGNALSSTFTQHGSSSGTHGSRTSVTVVDRSHSPASARFLASLSASKAFSVSSSTSVADARQRLADGDVDVVATIPANFARTTVSDRAVQLSAVDSRVDQLNAAKVAVSTITDEGRAQSVLADHGSHASYTPFNFIQEKTSTTQDPAAGLSGITYYTVTMLVLILLYGLGNTMNFVKDEYDGPLGDRYLASPTGTGRLMSAEVVAGTLCSVLQAAVVVMTARVCFGAALGSRPWVVAVIVCVSALLFNSIGLLLGVLGRSRPWLDPLVSLLIPLMTFVGGGFVKLDFGGLSNLAVNSVFQSALFREISGYATQWTPLLVSVSVAAAALVASAFLIGQRGAVR